MEAPNKKIIDKTLNNTAKPEEAREVVRWFSTSEGKSYLCDLMDNDENTILQGTEDKQIDHDIPSNEMYEEIKRRIQWQSRKRFFFRVAAVLIPFILIASIYFELNSRVDLFSPSEYDEIYVPAGEQLQFMFQDGSRVYLNSESRLRYPRKFGFAERKVELEGQGFFDIAENKNRPFIIDMHAITVKVTGTSFDTKAYESEEFIMVSLEEGSVALESSRFKTFDIHQGEQVIYNRKTGSYQIIRPQDISNASAWKDKKLIFKDMPINEVLIILGRTFATSFEISDHAALKYNITLTTEKKELDFILHELEKIAPISFEANNDYIYVRMK
ncbi:MAG: FecR domain-containing protein [Tannerella sp.]|jgi:ferric-dicitrate binding protein FerR (iron transport regulator)|nr:FecR domain-containing protein [Tannerella sp.]